MSTVRRFRWAIRAIKCLTTAAFLLVALTGVANASTLQGECDALENMPKTHLLQAIQRAEEIGKHDSPLVRDEPNPAVQARFLSLYANLCNAKANDTKLGPEEKRFYFAKAFYGWVDYFAWLRDLPDDKKDAWLGKQVKWTALTKAQKSVVVAAKYLGDAAVSAIWDRPGPPPPVVLENGFPAVQAYEKIDEMWLNEDAIDNWGRAFHPPDELLDAPEEPIKKILESAAWKEHWTTYGQVVKRRADGIFTKKISEKFDKIAAKITQMGLRQGP